MSGAFDWMEKDGHGHYEIRKDDMSDNPLYDAVEDAMWQALDSEQGMPHSGVDPAYVIPEFLRRLAESGYTITPTDLT